MYGAEMSAIFLNIASKSLTDGCVPLLETASAGVLALLKAGRQARLRSPLAGTLCCSEQPLRRIVNNIPNARRAMFIQLLRFSDHWSEIWICAHIDELLLT